MSSVHVTPASHSQWTSYRNSTGWQQNKTDLWKRCMLKPWPNGRARRRKWKTWVFMHSVWRGLYIFLWISSFILFINWKSLFYVACLTMALNATCSLAALQDICFIRGSVPLKHCLLWVSYRSEVITYDLYLNLILLPLGIPNFFLIFDVAADIYLLTGLIYLLFPLAHEDFFVYVFLGRFTRLTSTQ